MEQTCQNDDFGLRDEVVMVLMTEVKNKGPSGKTTPKGWVKYMRQRAKWKAASKGWVKNCVTVKNAKLVKMWCDEDENVQVQAARNGPSDQSSKLGWYGKVMHCHFQPIFFQVHMYQYFSRVTCIHIFQVTWIHIFPGSHVPIFFQVHMYGSKWLWSGYGVQLPLPSRPRLLWLQSIIPLGLKWIWISFGLNFVLQCWGQIEAASPFWGWIYALQWDILVSRYLDI